MKRRRVLFVDHTAVMGGGELSLLDIATAYRETSQVLLFTDGPFR
ncbi:MAG: glycosyltransferase family 1 protein, partial [Cyanobacteria bacterium SW_9_47_5]